MPSNSRTLAARPAAQADSAWSNCYIPVPHCRRQPLGALQHHQKSAAEKSRASGPEIFRRNADSCRRRNARGDSALRRWLSHRSLVAEPLVAGLYCVGLVFNGQYLAILESKRSGPARASPVLGVPAHRRFLLPALVLFRIRSLLNVPALPRVGRARALHLCDEAASAHCSRLRT